jgi:putative flippase GtrA
LSDTPSIDHRSFRHWGGFIFSGLTAFLVDWLVIWMLHTWFGVGPNLANLGGILVATLVAWLLHRRISFNVPYPPSLREFARFFVFASVANAASWVSNALLTHLFLYTLDVPLDAPIGWLGPVTPLEAAFVLSRCVGGAVSYVGFRFGVFHYRFDKEQATAAVPRTAQ